VHRAHLALAAPCFLALAAARAPAQTIDGTLFHDVDRDGVRDPGEPALAGAAVTLYGADGGVDTTIASGADGTFSFAATAGLQYVLDVAPGAAWRLSFQDLGADPDPIPAWPQGRRRPGLAEGLVARLRASTPGSPLVHVALGDSIGYGFNLCDSPGGKNDYVTPLTTVKLDRAGSATLQKLPELGYETADLLDPAQPGTIFDAIAAGAQLVTISIGGNDFLADDGNHAATAANLVAARQNLQELLATLESELPDAAIVLNTVYDNEHGGSAFHNEWAGVWNQALRDVAWGQRRRVAIAEVWPDYEHEDPATGTLLGEDDLICGFFGLDKIHPKKRGYDLHEEKVWQGIGGVTAATSATETRDFGFVERLASRFATVATDVGGNASQLPDALVEDDVGAVIPAGASEVRLSGFDATPRGLLSQVVVKARYRTVGPSTDDDYRIEASVDGSFAAAGATSSTWNTRVPIVGGAGNGVPVLAARDQGFWRDVSALVTKGAPEDGAPSLAWGDLATLAVRLVGLPVGAADGYTIEWDAVELELWGVPPYVLLERGAPVIGTTIEVDTTGTQGADCWLWASAAPASFPFPPFGQFGIDLAAALLLDRGPIGANGARTVAIDIPADPTLIGLTGYLQSLVVDSYKPKAGALTNVVELTLQ